MTAMLADRIRAHLDTVAQLRAARAADPGLAARVHGLKAFQALRFGRTYADLLASPRYGGAARFFLEELYGPQEFAERDRQFSRVVPALVRLFPREVVDTVERLGELHALSEALDDAAARQLPPAAAQDRQSAPPQPDPADYLRAWQAVGRAPARERQIVLTQAIGRALDGFTRSRLMRSSLRLMRGPAHAAGLGALQRFLETGFDAFGAMQGADQFLAWIGGRERALAAALFAPDALAQLQAGDPASPLAWLPGAGVPPR